MGGAAKVTAFVTRVRGGDPEVLVFEHPLAGVQLPAGTVEDGEPPLTGALREAWEETGLDRLRLVDALGSTTTGQGVVRHFFHFACLVETAEHWWVATPDGGGLCWRCRWAPIREVTLVDGQHEWLEAFRDRVTAHAAPQRPVERRVAIDPTLVNDTTMEQFWAPPFGGGRTLRSWCEPGELDGDVCLGRALGVCFTPDGRVVLVSGDGRSLWNHPGGGREPGETIEETLRREVDEEACARVVRSTFLGWERWVEIDAVGQVLGVNHQARFAAHVELDPFVARHETAARVVVPLTDVPGRLTTWPPEPLSRLLDRAVRSCGPSA